MTVTAPLIKLNNGLEIPAIGLGEYTELTRDTENALSHTFLLRNLAISS